VSTPQIGIAIVAPSGYTQDAAAIASGIARLEAQGCTVHNYFDVARVHQRFGDTDEGRLAQLGAAAADPAVDVVMALRGQYGLSRILPRIDFQAMADSGKIFCGFSDFTAFQMGLLAKTGALSYAGPMFFSDFCHAQLDEFTIGDFWRCLAGPRHRISEKAAGNPSVSVNGTIWGGNLAMIMSLLGTEYFPQIEGGILFLEDVNEHPYRVERMLLTLMQAGVLARQRAVVLGDFSAYSLSPADNGYNFDTMLAYLRATLPVPVLTGLTHGHGRTRTTIPFGAPATLMSDAEGFTIDIGSYPTRPNV
jgi:muramoyltetrapeptide carboxypeptidase